MITPRLSACFRALALLALPVVFGACATTAKKPADPSELRIIERKIVTTEYDYITPTGSNIPVRVPKGQGPMAGSGVSTMSAEAFRDIVTRGNTGRRR